MAILNEWNGKKNNTQKIIDPNGARSVYVAKRKHHDVDQYAFCYRNGGKLIGNILTTEKEIGHWAILSNKNKKVGEVLDIVLDNVHADHVYNNWLLSVVQVTTVQAVTPWFECRTGQLTGTTAKNILRCTKFVLLDDASTTLDAIDFFSLIGVTLTRPTTENVSKKTKKEKKKFYTLLGYTDVPKDEDLDEVYRKQIPHDKLVFGKLVRSWCMTPIKSKGKKYLDAFAQGRLAEPKVNKAVSLFFEKRNFNLRIVNSWNTGLVKRVSYHIISASPDGMCVLQIGSNGVLLLNDEVPASKELYLKINKF